MYASLCVCNFGLVRVSCKTCLTMSSYHRAYGQAFYCQDVKCLYLYKKIPTDTKQSIFSLWNFVKWKKNGFNHYLLNYRLTASDLKSDPKIRNLADDGYIIGIGFVKSPKVCLYKHLLTILIPNESVNSWSNSAFME